MKIDILTLFPEMFPGVFTSSIVGKARDKSLVELNMVNFRDFASNKHHTVDDYPYGGGAGMVLQPEPIFTAVESLQNDESVNPRIVLMCPQGKPFTQHMAEDLAKEKHLIIICGHYEGYDERIREHLITDEISIGDYVLTGGEIPAMVIIDSIVRLIPGVLGNELSAISDSFRKPLLEHPHYTRPSLFRKWKVPDILLSGHHANIDLWRRKESIRRTLIRRPELLSQYDLSKEEALWLDQIKKEIKDQSHD